MPTYQLSETHFLVADCSVPAFQTETWALLGGPWNQAGCSALSMNGNSGVHFPGVSHLRGQHVLEEVAFLSPDSLSLTWLRRSVVSYRLHEVAKRTSLPVVQE